MDFHQFRLFWWWSDYYGQHAITRRYLHINLHIRDVMIDNQFHDDLLYTHLR